MASRILLSQEIGNHLSKSKIFQLYIFFSHLMISLYKKQYNTPTRCNVYNRGGGPWNANKKEWINACHYRTNVLLYIWSIMSDLPSKTEKYYINMLFQN